MRNKGMVMRYIYILFCASFLFAVSKQTLGTVNREIITLFEQERLEEILPRVQKKLKNLDSKNNTSSLELYLKLWEIKGHFYLGEIDSTLSKFEILKNRVEDEGDNYNSLLFEIPFKGYVDKQKKGKEKNCITEQLTKQMKAFWNLEILNPDRLSEHFADLYLKIGKYDQKSNKVIEDIHNEKTRIIDREEKGVEYSIFPYFLPDQEIKLEDYSDFEKILRYEFEIAKRSRFEILQKQDRKPIEFDTEINANKSYACTIKQLPIYRESKVFITDVVETGFYKLYIHNSFNKKTDRYSFREESLKGGKGNLVLLVWDEKNWDMQELYDKNIITLSIPSNMSNSIEISLNNDKTLPLSSYKKGVGINRKIKVEESFVNSKDQDKWSLGGEDRIEFKANKDSKIKGGKVPVKKIEIDVTEGSEALNIKIDNKDNNDPKWPKRLFLGILSLSLIVLLY